MKYEYKCPVCRVVIEVERKMRDVSPEYCPDCGVEMKRRFFSPRIHMCTRSTRRPDTPSNKEYQAYKRYEASGDMNDFRLAQQIKGEIK